MNRGKSNARCMDMQARARKRIPGMTQLLSKRPDQFTLGVWPGYYAKAQGAQVTDLDGNEYLDMSIGGIGATALGYADPDVDEAVLRAVRDGSASSLNCPEEVELAELLCEIHPWASMVRYARTGGEAMAVAVRLARAATGRDLVAVCGYHGWHDWYMAANLGANDALDGHLLPGLDPAGVPRALAGSVATFHFNRLDELAAIVAARGTELAAVVMEPVRNDEPAPGFLEGVCDLARESGAVLVFDEISAGFRIRPGGSHLAYGVEPDMAAFSKAMGNGYAIAAVIGRPRVMEAASRTFVSSTNWTERVGFAAGLATLAKHRRLPVAERLVALGTRVQQGWAELAARHGLDIEVGGMKPLSHFTFEGGRHPELKAYFVQEMLDRGILASNIFYAMYAHTDQDVDRYLAAVDECFGLAARALAAGDLAGRLRGAPAATGFKRLN